MARVDPFVIQWPRKWIEDPDLNSTIQYLNKFLYDLWIRTGGGDDTIESVIESESGSDGYIGRLHSLNNSLKKRIDDLENQLDFDQINARIAATNKRIDEVIQTLLDKLDELKPDKDIEFRTIEAIEEIVKQLELSNAKLEEAFETQINREDI